MKISREIAFFLSYLISSVSNFPYHRIDTLFRTENSDSISGGRIMESIGTIVVLKYHRYRLRCIVVRDTSKWKKKVKEDDSMPDRKNRLESNFHAR